MSQAGITSLSSSNPDVATSYPTDFGTAIPASNILNILGGSGISTSASGNTVTIDLESTTALEFDGNSGTAIPSGNTLNIIGSNGVTTVGSGDTITISLSGGSAAIDSIHPDTGTDPVVPDANGLLNLIGTDYITTDGSLNTVTTNLTTNAITSAIYPWISSTMEKIYAYATSDGATITCYVERSGGGNLTVLFSDGYFDWVTPPDSVALTPGTDAIPVTNYVYMPISTKVLTSSSSDWPSEEYLPVARIICQSAASFQTQTAYSFHLYSNEPYATGENGHISQINYWIREQNATWVSGVVQTYTITPNIGTPDNVLITTTSGQVLQLHNQTFPAFIGTPDYYVVNDFTSPYMVVNDLSDLLTDSTGATLVNRYFSLVLWGNVSQDTGDCKLYINLPSGSYNNASAAIADASKYTVYTIPSDFTGTGFLISQWILSQSNSSGGTWTSISEIDLRGQIPSIFAGGSSLTSVTFPDSSFRIFDDLDDTKNIAFQASSITTGTTRTITMLDADINLANVVQNASTSTDNAIARFNGTTGKSIQNSGVIIDDSDNVTGVTTLNVDGNSTSAIVVNTTSLVVDSTNSRIGVGTASPSHKIHALQTSSGLLTYLLQLQNFATGNQTAAGIGFSTTTSLTTNKGAIAYVRNNTYGNGRGDFYFLQNNTAAGGDAALSDVVMILDVTGHLSIGTSLPTAVLHLRAGTTAASTAPLKFTSGTNLTAAEAGAVEWDGTSLFLTNSVPTRQAVALMSSSFLTNNGVALGDGTATLTSTAAGTTGQVLAGNTGSAPTFQNLSSLGVTSVTGTANRITASPTTGDVIVDISASYVGQTSITTLGTIGTGTWQGTLIGVTYGGTGTSTQFTTGSVVFAGASGVYTQDNSSFFWDDTNNRLGIGTASPSSTLHITKASVSSSGVIPYLQVDQVADTSQTASTEGPTVLFNFDSATRTWATGALDTQRYFRIDQPTIAFAGASTVTNLASLGIVGAPIKGTNATVTNTHGILVNAGAVSTAVNSYGLSVNAQTGATNNYAAQFIGGNVGVRTASPTGYLHLGAGTATASTAPLKFTTGINLTAPEAGTMEFSSSVFYLTPSSTRYPIMLGPTGVSSTDNAIARWDGTTGNILQNSLVFIDDTGNITGVNDLNVNSNLNVSGGGGFPTGDFVVATDLIFASTFLNGVGIFNTNPTAYLHLGAGGTAEAPFKFTTGTNLTTPEAGAMEFSSSVFYLTPVATRLAIALMSSSFLTNHGVVIGAGTSTLSSTTAGTSGQLLTSQGAASDPTWTSTTFPSTVAQGDLLYGSASNVITALAKNTSSTRYLSNTGTSNNPEWAQVALTTGVSGTLPVGNGGTGTATTFTAGSVIFAGPSGIYAQDNANLFWNDTNNRLGIGTASPITKFTLQGENFSSTGNACFLGPSTTTLNSSALLSKYPIIMIAAGETAPANNPALLGIVTTNLGGGVIYGRIDFAATNSTAAQINSSTFTILADNDEIGAVQFLGDDGTDLRTIGAKIQGQVDGTPAANSIPTGIDFHTMANGSTTLSLKMALRSSGYLGIGTALPATILETQEDTTLTGNVTDSYTAGHTIDPSYTVADGGNYTVTRLNYLDLNTPTTTLTSGTITITDAAVMRFDAAAGTHKAVDSGTTKTTPGTVDAWVKVNIAGTIYYLPAYTSKTT